jgi:DNA-binding MarR family transcriptional regulator
MKDSQKIEYLISLFFNTGRLIKEKHGNDEGIGCPIIHGSHFSMLRVEVIRLIEIEEPTMKRIAEYLHIKAPSATSLVNGLVQIGYVKRISDPNDRRMVQMKITDKGREYLKDGMKHMTEKIKEVLSKLKKDQIDNFIKIMEDINNAYK